MQQLPFSLSQKEIWTEMLAWPQHNHLNIGGFSRLEGEINPPLLQQALDDMVQHCDVLRMVPHLDGTQTLLDTVRYPIEFHDFRSNPQAVDAANNWQKQWMATPFQVNDTPPCRFAILTVADTCHYIVIQCLHILMDGWSLSNTVRLWGQFYSRLCSPQITEMPAEQSYREYIEESLKYRDSKMYARDIQFWQEHLPNLPPLLFDGRYRANEQTIAAKASVESCSIQRQTIQQLAGIAAELKCTVFHCLLSILAIYLFKSQGKQEFIIGVPSLNRSGGKYKNTLGMFVGVLPIKINCTASDTPLNVIVQVSKTLKQCYRHAKLPLSEQFKRLKAINLGQERIFDVIFSYENFEFNCHYGEAEVVATTQTFSGFSRFPLAISIAEFEATNDAEMVLEGNEKYFSAAETLLIGTRFLSLCEQVLETPNKPLELFSICSEPEKKAILAQAHGQRGATSTASSFIELVTSRAVIAPNNTALVWQNGQMTYSQMMAKAQHFSAILVQHGVKSGDVITLGLHRGSESVIALLAVSMVGAAFLFVDTEIPIARLNAILEQSKSTLLVFNKENRSRFNDINVSLLPLVLTDLNLTSDISTATYHDIKPDTLAYVVFTSGTSGTPKGVCVSHSALINRLMWIVEHWQIDQYDRSLQATQLSFDPALIELLAPLLNGGSVAFPPTGRLLPESLPNWVNTYSATMMAFVPSTLNRFIDGLTPGQALSLRICCCGGEVLSQRLAQRFLEVTGATLFNVYGPSEATIFATSWQVKPGDKHHDALPIGMPLATTELYVLDNKFELLPYGVVGEIYIGGETLASGYINEPNITAASFLQLDTVASTRLYKTGDFGWIGTDGVVHFCGRTDRQIKLRGYRIELAEIEAVLASTPGINSVAVDIKGEGSKASLHAWIVAEGKNAQLLETVRNTLKRQLPDYMLPSQYHLVAELPYNGNGKLNYSKLKQVESYQIEHKSRQAIGELETQILTIWQTVLGRPNLTVGEHFFESGGDSFSAVQVLNELEHKVNKRLSLHHLVENPTVASLAERLESELGLPPLIVSLGDTTRNISLYIAASGNGDMLRFKALAEAMQGICDLHMLQPPGNETAMTIEQLASLYADKIIDRGETEIYLAGFSVGGLAALATAKQLEKEGVQVKELFIVDTILLKLPKVILLLWQKAMLYMQKEHSWCRVLLPRKLYNALKDRGLFLQVKGMNDYRPGHYRGATALIKSSRYRMIQSWLVKGWQNIIQSPVKTFTIETSHSGFFEPGKVNKLAELLRYRIQKGIKTDDHPQD